MMAVVGVLWMHKRRAFSAARSSTHEAVYLDTVLSEDLRVTDVGRGNGNCSLEFCNEQVPGSHTAAEDIRSALDLIQAVKKRKANTTRIVNGALTMYLGCYLIN